jgi:hypothetical protein
MKAASKKEGMEAEEKLATYQKNEKGPLPAQKLARSILIWK